MEKKFIAKLNPYEDFINDLIEYTEYMIILENFDDLCSFGYFSKEVNRGVSTSIDCVLYNRKLNQCKQALSEYDMYDEEIRVYVKW